jgi:hypothetical protein
MSYQVIDNYLNIEDFKKIQKTFYDTNINWYFADKVATPEEVEPIQEFYFVHNLYQDAAPRSDYFKALKPLASKLKIKSFVRVKVNLFTRTDKIYKFGWHTDQLYKSPAAILYLNTCNGGTELETGTKEKSNVQLVKSVSNRVLLFDTFTAHRSTSCTDKKSRMNININYF